MKITSKEFERYKKQIVLKKIGFSGQNKITKAKVLIVGIGGLGCPLLIYLANLGIGKIGIVDNDKVELSNLNRQIIFRYQDIGKFKVELAKNFVKKINKKIKIKIFKKKLCEENKNKIMNKFDIICDGTDNFETRYIINDYCKKNKKILISAAISKFEGHLFKFNFKKKSNCFRCFMPDIPDEIQNCDIDGVIPTLAGTMGTIQANEVVKSIIGVSNDLHNKILIYNALKTDFRKVKISRNSKCINKC